MPPDPWHQLNIEFPQPTTTEAVASLELRPILNRLRALGELRTWWYLRKSPGLRLRYQASEPSTSLEELLGKLQADGHVSSFSRETYEPETTAFGGPAAMDVAHELFHHDSRHLLDHATVRGTLRRRETSTLLFSALLRGAGLDWFECGDAWVKVGELRPADRGPRLAPERTHELASQIRTLMTARPASTPLPEAWTGAYATAGASFAALARTGELARGLRSVLAHHFIFHANRAGLSGAEQATLAYLASVAVFDIPPNPTPPVLSHPDSKVHAMPITLSDSPTADQLRDALADRLVRHGVLRSPEIEQAVRTVERHLFVPEVPLDQAYLDEAVYTKLDEASGAFISAASQPTIVALMLEQLHVQDGQRVLELGAGTGYNAALLGHLAGDDGHVVTIDVDEDLVDGARSHLAAANVANVEAVLADGALGYPDRAPYDRIIATVGAYEVPNAWLDQLAPEGRLVVPLRLAGAACRSVVLERGEGEWSVTGSEMAVFMPLRGIGDDARRVITLAEGVSLQAHRDNDQATDPRTLAGVLQTARHETWTGVLFGSGESFEWLDLYLACALDNPIMRMNVEPEAKDSDLVSPIFPRSAMATTTANGDLAYLTIRPAEPASDGTKRFEVGIISHGPTAQDLAERIRSLITAWDRQFRTLTAHISLPDSTDGFEPDADAGRFLLPRDRRPMTVTWR